MISKTLLIKGSVACSVLSAAGVGAATILKNMDSSKIIQEEIKKRFIGWTNRSVLERAGFKDVSTDSNIFKTSLSIRFEDFVSTQETVERLVSFCKEGLDDPFDGITDKYKKLALVCSGKLTVSGKVARERLTLADEAEIREKISTTNKEQRKRELVKELLSSSKGSLVDVCKSNESSDIFAFSFSKEKLADYMTFCVSEKPSVIRFWTGVDNPGEIPQETEVSNEVLEVSEPVEERSVQEQVEVSDQSENPVKEEKVETEVTATTLEVKSEVAPEESTEVLLSDTPETEVDEQIVSVASEKTEARIQTEAELQEWARKEWEKARDKFKQEKEQQVKALLEKCNQLEQAQKAELEKQAAEASKKAEDDFEAARKTQEAEDLEKLRQAFEEIERDKKLQENERISKQKKFMEELSRKQEEIFNRNKGLFEKEMSTTYSNNHSLFTTYRVGR